LTLAGFPEPIGGANQGHSDGAENGREQRDKPIGRVLEKSIIPVALLLSFLALLAAVAWGGVRIASASVLLFGVGWLGSIIWFDLLGREA
jgi:hypothetical protein